MRAQIAVLPHSHGEAAGFAWYCHESQESSQYCLLVLSLDHKSSALPGLVLKASTTGLKHLSVFFDRYCRSRESTYSHHGRKNSSRPARDLLDRTPICLSVWYGRHEAQSSRTKQHAPTHRKLGTAGGLVFHSCAHPQDPFTGVETLLTRGQPGLS